MRVRQWLEIASGGESSLDNYNTRDETWLGTAALLLDGDFQDAEPLVILEGVPGQGKSTIAQYICQIHRMRLLEDPEHRTIDTPHFMLPLRLPFKVELRDFATWISGDHPFANVMGGESQDASPRSLEGFLSALVRYGSGGSAFDVSDLHATLSSSPTLIVLDGLDEVAEIRLRERVVDEISSGVTRLRSLAISLQVVVTSRPTPFTNSPVLPRRSFATYSLESLTRPLITGYADRWLKALDIAESEAKDIQKILYAKLDEPHLRDLARNPMQLAILLSLMHRKGLSLPDKRTALYHTYVEIFFDRESEKATIVRENRDLLIRMHSYLAWVLQAGAEINAASAAEMQMSGIPSSGSISEQDLRVLLKEFLERDGIDPTFVDKLFTGMVERVVAIVSRVQGTYEFDVQTLREFFAARHLYETAPYSPPGDQRSGTRSNRWAALSRNYYWLNVARFYAGFYSEGELPSLIDDLRVLCGEDIFRYTSHPQLLTATLLQDWVFSQRPRAIQDAVDLLLEPRGLRMLVAGAGSGQRRVEAVIVRDPVGRERLIETCKELVRPNRPAEQAMDVLRNALRPNSEPAEMLDWWMAELRSADKSQAQHWCMVGEQLQGWSVVGLEAVRDLLNREEVPSSSVISGLLHANRMDILESTEELFEGAVEAVLSGERVGGSRGTSILQRLAWSLEWKLVRRRDRNDTLATRISLLEYMRIFRGHEGFEEDIAYPDYPTATRCARLLEAYKSAAGRPLVDWYTSTEPWNRLVQQGVIDFGERPRLVELANLAAGIRSKDERSGDSPDLFNGNQPLVQRARYARLRAGSQKWWSKQLESATTEDQAWMGLLLFFSWAGTRTIEELARDLDKRIASLTTTEWYRLYSSVHRTAELSSGRSWNKPLVIQVKRLPQSLSARTVALLAERSTPGITDELYERYLADYADSDSVIASLRTDVQLRRAIGDERNWFQAIESLRTSYSLGAPTTRGLIEALFPLRGRDTNLPDNVVRAIVDTPLEFPNALVRVAEARCRQIDATKISPVARVAADESWFID